MKNKIVLTFLALLSLNSFSNDPNGEWLTQCHDGQKFYLKIDSEKWEIGYKDFETDDCSNLSSISDMPLKLLEDNNGIKNFEAQGIGYKFFNQENVLYNNENKWCGRNDWKVKERVFFKTTNTCYIENISVTNFQLSININEDKLELSMFDDGITQETIQLTKAKQ